MKKTMRTAALLTSVVLFPSMVMAGTATEEKLLQQLKTLAGKMEALTDKVMTQQKHIENLELKLSHHSKIITKVENSGDREPPITVSRVIDRVTIKGDLRIRYEHRKRDIIGNDDDTRNRWRSRVRLGGVWENENENWQIGLGIASGGSDATSTNYTWSKNEIFETSDLRLDYAYAKHTKNSFSVTAGQHKNPFETSWLYWDSDLRPTGLTLQYGNKTGLFATGGGYGVRYYKTGSGNTAMLYAGQIGWKTKINNVKFLAASGFQYWDSVFSNQEAPNDDYDFQVADLYTKLTFPAGLAKLSFYGQIWNNFGADGDKGQGIVGGTLDPDNENMGWILGMTAKINAVKLKASYTEIEADSLMGDITDQDFGSGLSNTDIKGFKLGASYSFSKNWSLGVTGQFYEALERDDENEVDLYMVDMKYKF